MSERIYPYRLTQRIFGTTGEDFTTYYLCVPYSSNPEKSIKRNFQIMKSLLDMGKFAFSPVAHTHFFHKFWQDVSVRVPYEQYIKWDFHIALAMLGQSEGIWCGDYNHDLVFLMDTDWEQSKGCNGEWDWAKNRYVHRFCVDPFLNRKVEFACRKGDY